MGGAFFGCFLFTTAALTLSGGCKQAVHLQTSAIRPISSENCSGCHREIFAAWLHSPHRTAWSNEEYRNSLAETGTSACFGCHAPRVLEDGRKAELRESNLMEGVNCLACHGGACPHVTLEGAGGGMSRVNPPDPVDRRSALCGICHTGTFEEWRDYASAAAAGSDGPPKDCVDCHMGADMDGNDHAGHGFALRYGKNIAIEVSGIEARPGGGHRVEILLCNRVAGHALPSGYYGFKEVRLEVWFGDRTDESVQSRRFFVELKNALQPGWNGPYCFTFEADGDLLHAQVRRLGPGGKEIAILGAYTAGLREIRSNR